MAKDFSTRPSAYFGLNDPADAWLAYAIDRATWAWGTFIQGKIDAQKMVPAKKQSSKQPMVPAPKYDTEQIRWMLSGDLTQPGGRTNQKVDVFDPFSIDVEDDHPRMRKEYRSPVPTE